MVIFDFIGSSMFNFSRWLYHVTWLMSHFHAVLTQKPSDAGPLSSSNWAARLKRFQYVDRLFLREVWRGWRKRDHAILAGDEPGWQKLDDAIVEKLKRYGTEEFKAKVAKHLEREDWRDLLLDPIQDVFCILKEAAALVWLVARAKPFSWGYYGRFRERQHRRVHQKVEKHTGLDLDELSGLSDDEAKKKIREKLEGLFPGAHVIEMSDADLPKNLPPELRKHIEKLRAKKRKQDNPLEELETEEWEKSGGPVAN